MTSRNFIRLSIVLLLVVVLAGAACKTATETTTNSNETNANSGTASDNTSSTPPFTTKEPDKYQATVIISGVPGEGGSTIPLVASLANQRMFVARDGDKRRADTELIPGVKLTYLQLPAGRYVLYPPKKMYAEINPNSEADPTGAFSRGASDFSPDKLINQTSPGARYEKLGTEQVNGRTTTKYRVTSGTADKDKTETLIWVDESLGMPIKAESMSPGGSRFTMEMQDIRQDVDATTFDLPKDYKKVEHKDILAEIIPSLPDILGNKPAASPTPKKP